MHPRASVVRRTLSIAVVATLVTAGAASATTKKKPRKPPPPPKPVCHLVGAGTGTTTDQSLKITSADLASNASTLTVVVRVAKLTTGTDPNAPTGRQWELDFTADGHQQSLGIYDGPSGTTTTYGVGTATLDTTKNEVRFSISLKDLSAATSTPTVKNGSTSFSNFAAFTALVVQSPPGSHTAGFGPSLWPLENADRAVSSSKTKYTAGYPSCVAVGK
jgi:hypothetical protein